jgi:hypothetical protein
VKKWAKVGVEQQKPDWIMKKQDLLPCALALSFLPARHQDSHRIVDRNGTFSK